MDKNTLSEADKIREAMVMKAVEEMVQELRKYSDDVIVKSKFRSIRIKTKII